MNELDCFALISDQGAGAYDASVRQVGTEGDLPESVAVVGTPFCVVSQATVHPNDRSARLGIFSHEHERVDVEFDGFGSPLFRAISPSTFPYAIPEPVSVDVFVEEFLDRVAFPIRESQITDSCVDTILQMGGQRLGSIRSLSQGSV